MFEKRKQVPIEARNYSTYYLVFSGLLFLGTMWAVVDEVATRRPWKEQQKEYYRLATTRIQERIDQAAADFDSASYIDLRAQLQVAQDSMKGERYGSVFAGYNNVLEQLVDATREYQFAKSRGDEAYYFYKRSLKEGREDLAEKKKLEENEAEMAAHQVDVRRLEASRDSLLVILSEYRQNVRNVQNKITDLRKGIEKWETKLKSLSSAPIEIKQVMMLDYDRNPFNDPKARVDRCQTCHLAWNEETMEDAPQPYKKHPLPELLAKHSPEVYGCTPCHRGQGAALTAGMAHGDEDHHWENPLLKGVDVYASCNECHENQSVLDATPVFTKAKRLMIESGCHGCHEIKGYTDLAKIGPELNRIGYKTNPQWVFRWARNPKDYNPHTRMPDFKFSDEQAEAVTAYLLDISSKNQFAYPKSAYLGGNAQRGKQLVETAGCQGCHVVGENLKVREARGTSYDIAPELNRVGSKVSPDWVYDWIRNPRHYNPTTKMPSLRLTEGEARDITAYLMTLHDERPMEPVTLNLESPIAIKKGEGLIREYGCNGCHVIQGMEKEGRVSVSLSNFGRKKVEEMDFGDTDVHHTWDDWVFNKLKNSRAFQTERIAQKMPVFAFSEEEIKLLRMFLLSETKDEPDRKYVQAFDKKQQNIESGRRLAIMYNCQQCHQLEKSGSHISANIEEAAFIPPIITGEGKKVQEPWLHDFLQNPSVAGQPNSIRPWIPTRMPTFNFSDDEINKLTKYFLGLSNQELELRDYAAVRPDPALLPVGRTIFEDFQCLKCHPSGNVVARPGEGSTADLAPVLTKGRGRLKPEWIVEWLADPNKLQEGTRMPTFWPDGQSPLPDVLDGSARKQMEAVRDYLISIGQPARPVVSAR
ncbi:MAG: putative octahem cytochrome c [Bacteroidetes bacterium]|nr:putative octahem cytochrome c [Bacteroidota bacterium]